MKKLALYAKKVKQLVTKLRKEKGKSTLPPLDDPMTALIRGVLTTYATEQRAEAAQARLLAATVDLNELRVTPISEVVGMMGSDFPYARFAAEELSRALNGVFNRLHSLDLAFMKTGSRKTAESFLNNLEGLGGHAKAAVLLRCLGVRVVPVDAQMLFFLQHGGYVPEGATAEEAQKLLGACIPEREMESLYLTLKRYSAAHGPRRSLFVRPTPAPVARREAVPEAVAEPKPMVATKEKGAAARKPAMASKTGPAAPSATEPSPPTGVRGSRSVATPAQTGGKGHSSSKASPAKSSRAKGGTSANESAKKSK